MFPVAVRAKVMQKVLEFHVKQGPIAFTFLDRPNSKLTVMEGMTL
jgi:hypothetical protein